jgi:hypothetical protein
MRLRLQPEVYPIRDVPFGKISAREERGRFRKARDKPICCSLRRVIVPIIGGDMKIVQQSGASEMNHWETGKAYWLTSTAPGTLHADCHAVRNEENVARKGGALHLIKRIQRSNGI